MSLVSVVIPTHNRETLLPRALDSVINQTYKKVEIIIVDDGSTDNTSKIIKDYQQKNTNIKYIKHKTALGGNAARNTGIKAAKGYFIAGLDDDDEFLPDRIELLVKNYSSKYSFVTSRSIKVFKTHKVKTRFIPEIDLNTILYYNAVGNQVLVEKEKIIEAGLFDENLKRYQDYDMWVRLIYNFGKAKCINKITQIIHYEHEISVNNISKKNYRNALLFYTKYKYLMSKTQRQNQLYLILYLRDKKISWKRLILVLNKFNYKSVIKTFVKNNIINFR